MLEWELGLELGLELELVYGLELGLDLEFEFEFDFEFGLAFHPRVRLRSHARVLTMDKCRSSNIRTFFSTLSWQREQQPTQQPT